MKRYAISTLAALAALSLQAQNAQQVLSDTNGIIRVGTNGSLLVSLNAAALASGTVAESRLPGILPALSAGDGSGLTNVGGGGNISSVGLTSTVAGLGFLGSPLITNGTMTLTGSIAASSLSGTIPTNNLPGLLPLLSVNNGGGTLTNLAFPVYTVYTNNPSTNTYTIPAGAKVLRIECVGQGGAGGSGRRGATNTIVSGGGGGGGGAYNSMMFLVAELWTNTFHFTLPSIKTGGAAVITDDSNGTNGTAATTIQIYNGSTAYSSNIVLRTASGNPGVGGDNNGSAGGTGGITGLVGGSAGGASHNGGQEGADGTSQLIGHGAGGGGGGGGIYTNSVASPGGNGGPTSAVMNPATITGGNPVPPSIFLDSLQIPRLSVGRIIGWPGGAGAGASVTNDAPAGANGEGWGSGAGGGGPSANTFNSGAGGNGGPAIVSFTAW